MGLKEKLEQSPGWFMTAIAVGGFIFGVSATIGVIQIIFQDQAQKASTIERLSQFPIWFIIIILTIGFGIGIIVMIIRQKYWPKKLIMGELSEIIKGLETNKQITKQKNEKEIMEYGPIFELGNPIPIGFKQVKMGMRLSILKSIFPEGNFFTYPMYVVKIKDHPIIKIMHCFISYDDENMNDGVVTKLQFVYQNTLSYEYLRNQALITFGSEKADSKLQGNILEWKNMNGFHVMIEKLYYTVEYE